MLSLSIQSPVLANAATDDAGKPHLICALDDELCRRLSRWSNIIERVSSLTDQAAQEYERQYKRKFSVNERNGLMGRMITHMLLIRAANRSSSGSTSTTFILVNHSY